MKLTYFVQICQSMAAWDSQTLKHMTTTRCKICIFVINNQPVSFFLFVIHMYNFIYAVSGILFCKLNIVAITLPQLILKFIEVSMCVYISHLSIYPSL